MAGEVNLFLARVMEGEEMPKSKSAAVKTKAQSRETDDELLAWSLGACFNNPPNGKELRALQESGATDDELLREIVVEWSTKNVGSERPFVTVEDDPKWGTAIWFDTLTASGPPSLHFNATDGKGTLLLSVRRVLGIDEPLEKNKGDSGLSQTVQDHALRLLLHPTAAESQRWAEFKRLNIPSDSALAMHLTSVWMPAVSRKNPDCCAGIRGLSPLVWFGQTHSKGTPSLSGAELYDAIRRILGMSLDDEADDEELIFGKAQEKPKPDFQELKRKGKSQAKKAPVESAEEEPVNLMAHVEVIEERDIPWAQIIRSKENPRQSFDAELIASMEPTIEAICRLTPLTVREGTLELIDGETRHRAAEKRKPPLRCKVIRCTDEQAAEIRLLTSLQRRDLNPIERAAAIVSLQTRHGLSQRQLEKVVKLKQGSISKLTRIVQLPEKWKEKVISKEITQSDAEALVPFKDEPEVLEVLEEELEEINGSYKFEEALANSVISASRPLVDDYYYSGGGRSLKINLKPTPEQRELLRVREVKYWNGRSAGERAFNLELWQQLVDEQQAKQSKRLDASGNSGKPDPKKAAENAKKQAEQLAKKLYRWRTSWYQAMCRAEVVEENVSSNEKLALMLFLSGQNGNSRRIETLSKATKIKAVTYTGNTNEKLLSGLQDSKDPDALMSTVLIQELSAPFDRYDSTLLPEEIHALAAAWKISIESDWIVSFEDDMPCKALWQDFCDLWSKDQILALLDEWKITRPPRAESMKRSELVKLLRKDKGCPAAIAKAKAVRLY